MVSNRNHEGYHDPTAYRAVQLVCRRREPPKVSHLTYTIGETRRFQEARKAIT